MKIKKNGFLENIYISNKSEHSWYHKYSEFQVYYKYSLNNYNKHIILTKSVLATYLNRDRFVQS